MCHESYKKNSHTCIEIIRLEICLSLFTFILQGRDVIAEWTLLTCNRLEIYYQININLETRKS